MAREREADAAARPAHDPSAGSDARKRSFETMVGGRDRLRAVERWDEERPRRGQDADPSLRQALMRPMSEATEVLARADRRYEQAFGPQAAQIDPATQDPIASPDAPYLSVARAAKFGMADPLYATDPAFRDAVSRRLRPVEQFEAELTLDAVADPPVGRLDADGLAGRPTIGFGGEEIEAADAPGASETRADWSAFAQVGPGSDAAGPWGVSDRPGEIVQVQSFVPPAVHEAFLEQLPGAPEAVDDALDDVSRAILGDDAVDDSDQQLARLRLEALRAAGGAIDDAAADEIGELISDGFLVDVDRRLSAAEAGLAPEARSAMLAEFGEAALSAEIDRIERRALAAAGGEALGDVVGFAADAATDAWELASAAIWGGELTLVDADGVERREHVDAETAQGMLAAAAGDFAAAAAVDMVLGVPIVVYEGVQIPGAVVDGVELEIERQGFLSGAEQAVRDGRISPDDYETILAGAHHASIGGVVAISLAIAEALPLARRIAKYRVEPSGRRVEADDLSRDAALYSGVDIAEHRYFDDDEDPIEDVDAFMELYGPDQPRGGSAGGPQTRRVIIEVQQLVQRVLPDAVHVAGGTRRERLECTGAGARRADLVFLVPGDPPVVLQFEIGQTLASGEPSLHERPGFDRWIAIWETASTADRLLYFYDRRPGD